MATKVTPPENPHSTRTTVNSYNGSVIARASINPCHTTEPTTIDRPGFTIFCFVPNASAPADAAVARSPIPVPPSPYSSSPITVIRPFTSGNTENSIRNEKKIKPGKSSFHLTYRNPSLKPERMLVVLTLAVTILESTFNAAIVASK
jgi:hypothetical protein